MVYPNFLLYSQGATKVTKNLQSASPYLKSPDMPKPPNRVCFVAQKVKEFIEDVQKIILQITQKALHLHYK